MNRLLVLAAVASGCGLLNVPLPGEEIRVAGGTDAGVETWTDVATTTETATGTETRTETATATGTETRTEAATATATSTSTVTATSTATSTEDETGTDPSTADETATSTDDGMQGGFIDLGTSLSTDPAIATDIFFTTKSFNGAAISFAVIPAGSFDMGSTSAEAYDDEKVVHRVTISRSFLMARTEVTQQQYVAVTGLANPAYFKGDQRPVETVSWTESVAFCQKLSELEALESAYDASSNVVLSKPGYRLPTEAEWEYAARARTTADRYGALDDIAWHSGNSGSQTHDVGGKRRNAWGLYDMLGNAWEWTADWYASSYASGAATDPTGPTGGSNRVNRGGSWFNDAGFVRAPNRDSDGPGGRHRSLGFRPARSLP